MEKPIRTTAPAALLICLLLLQATLSFSQFSVHGDFKALPANPPELDQAAVPWLPFEEDWSSGLFETNHWTLQQNSNWRIAGQEGNDAPSAEFYNNPPVTNYQKALSSRLLNARNLIDGNIYLSFDLKLTNVNPTGHELLKVQILNDTGWKTVWADSNIISYNWVNKKLNITNTVKGNTFRFRFLAEGQNSQDINKWQVDNISVYRECLPPLNLVCAVNFPNLWEVILTWEEPWANQFSWLGWDNGYNNDGLGLTDGGTFHVASRHIPAQLAQFAGTYLTTLRFFPFAEGTFVLKVWTGANASQLVLIQPVETIVVGSWNEIELDVPVYVSGTTEIWFGYTVTATSGNFPAGMDTGPAVAGFGDMISLDGSVWSSTSVTYALNYNWNIQGLVQVIDGADKKMLSSNLSHPDNSYQRKSGNPKTSGGNRELIRYDIYDCYSGLVLIGSTTETSFVYEPDLNQNGYCYVVSAVYTDCEAFSNECSMFIPEPAKPLQPFEIYPVPADQMLNIKVNSALLSFVITDFYYREVYQAKNINEGSFCINTSSYQNGMYLIKAMDAAGNISTGKFIVSH
jgi:hypothetical protein